METNEHETIIIINDGDMKEGFFRFTTTKASDFSRMCRRIGGEENLRSIAKHTQGSKVTAFIATLDRKYLSKTWTIGKKRKGGGNGFKKKVESQSEIYREGEK